MAESKPTRSRTAPAKQAEVTESVKAEPTPAPKPTPKPTPKSPEVVTSIIFRRRLSQGDHGPVVAEVQRVLAARGAWEGAQDGRYGTMLAKAVRQFQGSKGLKPTGEVDARTWEALTA
jgi:peptidoglycan hydrolase-like protein with peptidoglycan-binding domain